jgi:hypothetical protein
MGRSYKGFRRANFKLSFYDLRVEGIPLPVTNIDLARAHIPDRSWGMCCQSRRPSVRPKKVFHLSFLFSN